jgi:hypothetical protein
MHLTQKRIALLVVALVAVIAISPFLIRGALRMYALNKVLNLPGAKARMAIVPTRRILTNQAPIQLINLGYATFDVGFTNQLFMESRPSGGIILTNYDVAMVFYPPRARTPNITFGFSPKEIVANPNLHAHIMKYQADLISAEMEWEETQLIPPAKILFMNGDDFLLYSFKVKHKAPYRYGSKQVEFIQSSSVKGIVRRGETETDNLFAAVTFTSLDGTKLTGLSMKLTDPSSTNLSDYLDPILRSFCITVESVNDLEAIKALIREAGIPQRKEPPEDEE